MCGRQTHLLADADPQEFLSLADCSNMQNADVDTEVKDARGSVSVRTPHHRLVRARSPG